VSLSLLQWSQVLGVALLLLVTVEVGKWISNYRHRRMAVRTSQRRTA
jgi:hypothetical protein